MFPSQNLFHDEESNGPDRLIEQGGAGWGFPIGAPFRHHGAGHIVIEGARTDWLLSTTARTLAGFTQVYAGNPPTGYIDAFVSSMGVTADTQISTFLT